MFGAKNDRKLTLYHRYRHCLVTVSMAQPCMTDWWTYCSISPSRSSMSFFLCSSSSCRRWTKAWMSANTRAFWRTCQEHHAWRWARCATGSR